MSQKTKPTFIGGTERIPLTKGLLHLIVMVQEYQQSLMSQSLFNVTHNMESIDWEGETEKFFYKIDNAILEKYKLSKNEISFRKVTRFTVTEEMTETLYEELPNKNSF